jgi:hypothetical protein
VATDGIDLMELRQKHGSADLLKELGQWTLQCLMELEVEQSVGAGLREMYMTLVVITSSVGAVGKGRSVGSRRSLSFGNYLPEP